MMIGVTEIPEALESLGAGYYKFKPPDNERHSYLTEEIMEELLAPIDFQFIVDEIVEMYRKAKQRSERKTFIPFL